mgnify:CR=1 FL=1
MPERYSWLETGHRTATLSNIAGNVTPGYRSGSLNLFMGIGKENVHGTCYTQGRAGIVYIRIINPVGGIPIEKSG